MANKKHDDFVKNAEIAGAAVAGVVVGAGATALGAMALDPELKGKFEKKVEDIQSGIGEKRDEVVKKIDEAKKAVADKTK